jgi:hypothetical protein
MACVCGEKGFPFDFSLSTKAEEQLCASSHSLLQRHIYVCYLVQELE